MEKYPPLALILDGYMGLGQADLIVWRSAFGVRLLAFGVWRDGAMATAF
jgi:hypothetical protein